MAEFLQNLITGIPPFLWIYLQNKLWNIVSFNLCTPYWNSTKIWSTQNKMTVQYICNWTRAVPYLIILQRCSSSRGAAAVASFTFCALHKRSATTEARGLEITAQLLVHVHTQYCLFVTQSVHNLTTETFYLFLTL